MVYGFYTFVWRQAYFPETSASELKGDKLGVSCRSTGPYLFDTQFKLGGFVGLVSFGAPLAMCTGQCGCTKVEANCCIKRCYNSLTLIKKINISSIFLKRLQDFMD